MLGLGRFLSFLVVYTVGLAGRGINPSHDRYQHTGQQKHRINTHYIHASSGIGTHDPNV
jgi:hypothetical protein